MKKTLLTLLTLTALAACGGQNQGADNPPPPPSASMPNPPAHQHGANPADEQPLKQHEITGEKVNVKTMRGNVDVPKNPERIAVYDFGMLDTLSALGVNVGATVDNTRIAYLVPIVEKAVDVGTLFEPNYEALNAYQPQLIITGSRANKAIHQLNEIAPTIEMTAEPSDMRNSTKERIDAFAQIFNKQTEAEALKGKIDAAFEDAKAAAQGKGKGLVILVTGGKMSAYGATSRLGGWLHHDIGIEPADATIKEGTHGQPISFEYIKEKNPDWLFVLDRSAAIGEEGQAAKDVLDNPLVAETTAWKKGQVVYLDSGVYLAAGGAQQVINSANQIAQAFKAAK